MTTYTISGSAKRTQITVEALQTAYDAAYLRGFASILPDGKAAPGEHYSATDHVEAVRIGNMTVAQAMLRAEDGGYASGRQIAIDRRDGNLPPSARDSVDPAGCGDMRDKRTEEMWWSWHDENQSRWSQTTKEAEQRCTDWVAGTSEDGPRSADARAQHRANAGDAAQEL